MTAQRDPDGRAANGRDTGRRETHERASAVRAALREAGDPERAVHERAYLKSSLAHLGAGVPAIRRIARSEARGLGHDEVVTLAVELWSQPVHDERLAAVMVLGAGSKLLDPADLDVVEAFLHEAATWALVDPLSLEVAAPVVERHPDTSSVLDRWLVDPSFWLRRASLLALLPPVRAGGGDIERLGRYADALLDEREFFVRKAIGWCLRDAGRKRSAWVAAWLAPRIGRCSGVTIREAVKPLDPAERERLLAAWRRR